MNKQRISWLALLALLALPSLCSAQPIRCDTCRDDASFRAEAATAGEGTHLVYNLETGVVQQWYVGPGGDDEARDPPGLPNTRRTAEPSDRAREVKQIAPPDATVKHRRGQEASPTGATTGTAAAQAGDGALDHGSQH